MGFHPYTFTTLLRIVDSSKRISFVYVVGGCFQVSKDMGGLFVFLFDTNSYVVLLYPVEQYCMHCITSK